MRSNWLLLVWLGFLALSCARNIDYLWSEADIPLEGAPAYQYRILDHWDNLDDSVERGYAGPSIWEWTSEELPSARIAEYGRLNQKIGINGTVLNNVNASPAILDSAHLQRCAQIADILRPYGMRVYLSVNFASPAALGGLPTADPLDPAVAAWWKDKVAQIYSLIPDFGGFLVKASSEGQPGPQDFGRTHVDGANMLADALAPYHGIVMWRAFVYSSDSDDRARQAYDEFVPLDGQFRDNVSIQVKNGPVDFQPREPFSPLFGALPHSSVTPELQITMEYLGQASSLVFLAPMWEECLKSDTYARGKGSTVAAVSAASKPRLVREHLQPGQLVRLRAPGLGPGPILRPDCGRMAQDHLSQAPPDESESLRPRIHRPHERDYARFAGSLRRLYDAPRPAPPLRRRPSFRA